MEEKDYKMESIYRSFDDEFLTSDIKDYADHIRRYSNTDIKKSSSLERLLA